MTDPNDPQVPLLGSWIPPIFRSMVYCDEDGALWVIDQETWRWVRQDNGEPK